jgi:hypothetical protein
LSSAASARSSFAWSSSRRAVAAATVWPAATIAGSRSRAKASLVAIVRSSARQLGGGAGPGDLEGGQPLLGGRQLLGRLGHLVVARRQDHRADPGVIEEVVDVDDDVEDEPDQDERERGDADELVQLHQQWLERQARPVRP